ncbi:MAG: glycosyltransferase family 2 protein [Phycisphaerales bacterium]|nr:glycosyltransferase family 2 protein [Phycisphaerales bacterium]MCB9854169.1 glycosyltransferase family 2 protein [Phycisphaerales bacterium]MCB9864695.1 glycosyltransferase family 2 protein [Phycisphaerales bacterium]
MTSTPPLVSVVLITYKRVDTLRATVESFRRGCSYPNLEFILSDDGSPPRTQEEMRKIPFDKYVMAQKNEGLGRNQNKGLDAASGEFLLHLQDDWECVPPRDFVQAALELFEERADVQMIRLRRSADGVPFERYTTKSNRVANIYENGHFAASGISPYTDTPHIKRRSFHEALGPYLEGVRMWDCELDFCRRVDARPDVKIAFIEGYACFHHTGEDVSFNASAKKARIYKKLRANPFTRPLVSLYDVVRSRRRNDAGA